MFILFGNIRSNPARYILQKTSYFYIINILALTHSPVEDTVVCTPVKKYEQNYHSNALLNNGFKTNVLNQFLVQTLA